MVFPGPTAVSTASPIRASAPHHEIDLLSESPIRVPVWSSGGEFESRNSARISDVPRASVRSITGPRRLPRRADGERERVRCPRLSPEGSEPEVSVHSRRAAKSAGGSPARRGWRGETTSARKCIRVSGSGKLRLPVHKGSRTLPRVSRATASRLSSTSVN